MVDWECKCLVCAHGALGAGNISFSHLVYSWRNVTFLSGLSDWLNKLKCTSLTGATAVKTCLNILTDSGFSC